jgi:hypothetical protein
VDTVSPERDSEALALHAGPGRQVDAGTWSPGFATPQAVEISAALLEAVAPFADPGGVGLRRRYRLSLGPGKIRVASSLIGSEAPGADGLLEYEVCEPMPAGQYGPGKLVKVKRHVSTGGGRGVITQWSADSRLNMVEKMCSVDWSPVVAPERKGWRPAMVTLTLPGDWQAVAPSAAAFKKITERFWMRWSRRWGKPECVWKLEFQRRGAPHLHIYTAIPPGRDFQQWLSTTWYECVGSGDERHLRAGTGVDWGEGVRASDPKRLAVYFLKRAAGHNLKGSSKEYQHRVPQIWAESGGAGRFWGVKGLAKADVEVQLSDVDFIALRRLLRRWAKANGRPVRSLAGGVGQGGMVLANSAPTLLSQAARALRPAERSEAGRAARTGLAGRSPGPGGLGASGSAGLPGPRPQLR